LHLGGFVNRISAMNLLSLLGVLKDLQISLQKNPQPPVGEGPEGLRFMQAPTPAALEVEISNIVTDSRKLNERNSSVEQIWENRVGAPEGAPVFVAIKGTKQDGHDFIQSILESGTPVAAIVADESRISEIIDQPGFPPGPHDIPILLVPDTRVALDVLARRLFYDPSHRMLCFGVTGTNGKTSSVYMLEHLLNRAGQPTGVLGTIDHHLGSDVWPSTHTTPDPVSLQGRLSDMKAKGAQAIAMEVSSHALDQRRADGVQFNVVIFTNLTRDHLDYHADIEDYFLAKQRLFTDLMWNSTKFPLFAIVNVDDPWARKLRVSSKAIVWTIGVSKSADFQFKMLSQTFTGQKFSLQSPFGDFEKELPLIGVHNLYNAMGAVAAAASVGVTPEQSLRYLEDFEGIPGRLQRIPDRRGRFVFVDYAHTPDALDNVLKTLNEIRETLPEPRPRVLTLFGCGGDRDKGKRPQMAQVAARWSDAVWLTSDNPRSENPKAIIEEIRSGFSASDLSHVTEQVDRALAIQDILRSAQSGDVVLIAGKGHEDYQEIQGEKRSFSDVAEAERFLNS